MMKITLAVAAAAAVLTTAPPAIPVKAQELKMAQGGFGLKHAVSCALSHGPLSHETLPRVAAFTAEPGQESPISRAFHAIVSA